MRTIKTVKGQSLKDVAIQEYGNIDAVLLLLLDNPALGATADQGLAAELAAGTMLSIREEDPERNKAALREIGGATIATFN